MKKSLALLALALGLVLGTTGAQAVYWHHGGYHHGWGGWGGGGLHVYVGPGYGYYGGYYGGPYYYRPYYRTYDDGCQWIPGHYDYYGYWIPGHRACW